MAKSFLSTNLKYLLGLHSLTQTELSIKLGWGKSTISNYVNDKAKPSPDKLVVLSNYFKITVDDLIKRNLKVQGVTKTDNPQQGINDDLVKALARYERLLNELEQMKSVTEEDYERLWETVRQEAPELAKRIEEELRNEANG